MKMINKVGHLLYTAVTTALVVIPVGIMVGALIDIEKIHTQKK
jgi:hypothetical protein